jgi:hypothetical protein
MQASAKAGGIQCIEAGRHARERPAQVGDMGGVVLLEKRMGALEQRRVRLGRHLAGQRALHQPRHTVADPGGDLREIVLRHAELGEHAVRAGGEIGRGCRSACRRGRS